MLFIFTIMIVDVYKEMIKIGFYQGVYLANVLLSHRDQLLGA